MRHALQTILWLLLQYLAPRHNAQIRFLKAQVQILRRRIPAGRVIPDPAERAELLRLGAECSHGVSEILEIVKPGTYRRWMNDAQRGRQPRRAGRPRLGQELRDLVVRLGRENVRWGCRRIVGELGKLGQTLSANSVKRILRSEGIHPTPEKQQKRRPPTPWSQFIESHLDSLVACDFFTKPVHTLRGRVDAYCLVVIHLASRKVFCSPATFHPDAGWLMQQARNASMWMGENVPHPRFLLLDNDRKFTNQFRAFWNSMGIRPLRLPIGAPQANAYVEAFIANLKAECLNHYVILSRSQLNYIVETWVQYYNTERPHRGKGIDNRVLDKDFAPRNHGPVRCRQLLGGLVRAYYRDAA